MIMNKSPIKEKKELVREYIRNNPKCTYRDIRKNTKIKVERVYKNMKEAYKDPGIIPRQPPVEGLFMIFRFSISFYLLFKS